MILYERYPELVLYMERRVRDRAVKRLLDNRNPRLVYLGGFNEKGRELKVLVEQAERLQSEYDFPTREFGRAVDRKFANADEARDYLARMTAVLHNCMRTVDDAGVALKAHTLAVEEFAPAMSQLRLQPREVSIRIEYRAGQYWGTADTAIDLIGENGEKVEDAFGDTIEIELYGAGEPRSSDAVYEETCSEFRRCIEAYSGKQTP